MRKESFDRKNEKYGAYGCNNIELLAKIYYTID